MGAGEKDVVALQSKIFTNFFVSVFFFHFMYCMFRKGGGRMGGDDDLWGGYNARVRLAEWFGRGGGRLSGVWRWVELLMVLGWSESVSYV